MKRVVISVINDLVTDQRVHRVALTLNELGYDVLLVGRKMKSSLSLTPRPYKTHRMKMLFEKGPLFYVEYNFRLFCFLLFRKANVFYSNDLDTLLPNYLISRLKNKQLIYDSHEYFTGVPELQERPVIRSVWKAIEKGIVPKIKHFITVNQSIAELYHNEYGVEINVIRNVPIKQSMPKCMRLKLGIPENRKIIILQGAGINIDRGAEELVDAMQYVENAVLYIIGGGDVIGHLHAISDELKLEGKVKFIARLPFEELRKYTVCADLGVTLDKGSNINYKYSLPNKLFDYIHAGVPVLTSDLVEVKKIVKEYEVGEIVESYEPRIIAEKINKMLGNEEKLKIWRSNAIKASEVLNWQNESKKLTEIIEKVD